MTEPFAAIPRRAFRALEAHELTLAQLGLLAWIINVLAGGNERAATLATIKAATRFPFSDETLRHDLRVLHNGGWIVVVRPSKGGRSPYRFRPAGASPPSDLQVETPPKREGDLEVTSKTEVGAEAANAGGQTDSGLFRPPSRSAALDRDREVDGVTHRLVTGSSPGATAAALDLYEAIKPEHSDDGTRNVLLAYAKELTPEDFRGVRAELLRRRDAIRNEGRWVNGALGKIARKRAAT